MINDPLVKKLLANIVEKEYKETLSKRFKEEYPNDEVPENIYGIINALQLPKEEVDHIVDDIKQTVENTIIPIIKALNDGIETDDEIAEKTGIKLNIVRKILYKLYDLGIANYKRSKDPETQWFTYSWKFEEEELINQIIKNSEKEIADLNKELEYEENNMFFVCPYGHVRFDFDKASEEEFWCPCGEDLMFQDNQEIIERIKGNIDKSEKDLENFKEKVEK